MNDKEFDPHERTVPKERRRGGGQPMPRPAGGKAKKWEPPNQGHCTSGPEEAQRQSGA